MTVGSFFGLLLSLAVVFGLLRLTLTLLKRYATGELRAGGRLPLELHQRLTLGPRQGIAIVRIGDTLLAVAVGEGGVRVLHTVTPEERARYRATDADLTAPDGTPGPAPTPTVFATLFEAVRGQRAATGTTGATAGVAPLAETGTPARTTDPYDTGLRAGTAAAALFGPPDRAYRGGEWQAPAHRPTVVGLLRTAAQAVSARLRGSHQTWALVVAMSLAASAAGAQAPRGAAPVPAPAAAPTTAAERAAALQATLAPTAATRPGPAMGPSPVPPLRRTTAAAPATAPAATAGDRADQMLTKLAPTMDVRVGEGTGGLRLSGTVGIVVMMGLLTLLPSMLLMMTGFTRILVVLHFVKQALGTPTAPPSQLVAGLALLLTGFVMAPTLNEVNARALQPWMDGRITQVEMLQEGAVPLRAFMLRQTRDSDIEAFLEMSHRSDVRTIEDVPLTVVIAAFVTSELRTAFQIGFAIFLPFIIIDMVVASVLMGMGMFMLPPAMISMPFKLLLFVLVDGWTLIVQSLVQSFR